MEALLDQGRIAEAIINHTDGAFGQKIGLVAKLFGCWHKVLSRPFTYRRASYRACLHCGARKKFDAKTLQTFGPFFHPPAITFIDK